MRYYHAPWGRVLTWMSAGATTVCLGVACTVGMQGGYMAMAIGGLLVLLVVVCALYTIRGYTIVGDTLWVHRLVWVTRLPLAKLESAQYVPNAMKGSLRTMGNGGFYSISGRYWSRSLGSYRALVTDLNRTVVLRLDGRIVVVSPDEPEEFVREIKAAARLS